MFNETLSQNERGTQLRRVQTRFKGRLIERSYQLVDNRWVQYMRTVRVIH